MAELDNASGANIGRAEDLDEAVQIARDEITANPKGHANRASALNNLSIQLGIRSSFRGDMNDLKEAIFFARQAIKCAPENDPDLAVRLDNLGIRLSERFLATGAMKDLEEAVDITRQAALTPADCEDRTAILGHLGVRLGQKFSALGNLSDLEEAIDFSRQAVEFTPEGDPEKPMRLNNLGNRLHQRSERTGSVENLEEAITTGRQAVKTAPNDDPNKVRWLANLAGHLSTRFSKTGFMDDLRESIDLSRRIIEAIPYDDPTRPKWLHNISLSLRDKYLVTGEIKELHEAISFARQAVEASPPKNPERVEWANALSIQLGERYTRFGAKVDIEEAVRIIDEAIQVVPENKQSRVPLLNTRSNRLGERFSRTGSKADLQNAISAAREAKNATPKGHPDRPTILSNLSIRLGIRYSIRGGLRTIEDAVEAARQAVEATPKGHPDRPRWLANYGTQLASQAAQYLGVINLISDPAGESDFKFTPKRVLEGPAKRCLESAIKVTSLAVKTLPPGHLDRSKMLIDLGDRFSERYAVSRQPGDLKKACAHFRSALSFQPSSIRVRLMAGRRLLSATQDPQMAYLDAKSTIELIPLFVPNSLQSADKQYLLTEMAGIASLAAAIALSAGQKPLCAIEMLETGRGALASSLRDLRIDLSALRQTHPELERSFLSVRNRLDNPVPASNLAAAKTSSPTRVETTSDQRFEAEQQIAKIIKEIRLQPGFERFLLSASEVQMREAASDGPIAILNVSSHRCDALIIESSEIRLLELPELHQSDITKRRGNLQSPDTLRWLWDVIVSPVLDDLGFMQPQSGDAWPSVWWIPTGPLARFPIHAAGYHLDHGLRTALDRVISSYSTSIKSIIRTRQHRDLETAVKEVVSSKAVLVSMPDTPGGYGSLQYASKEVQEVQEVCKSMKLSAIRPRPYREIVSSALADCKIFHFAGHGSAKKNPLDSVILLEDWQTDPLKVETLLDTNLSSTPPFLAYLSACRTGQVRHDESLDESIHLVGAFQLAGFRHVIGTLWEVNDKLCVAMARLTYEFLRDRGISDQNVRGALHHAVRRLRDDWVRDQNDFQSQGRDLQHLSNNGPKNEWDGYDSDESASDEDDSDEDDTDESDSVEPDLEEDYLDEDDARDSISDESSKIDLEEFSDEDDAEESDLDESNSDEIDLEDPDRNGNEIDSEDSDSSQNVMVTSRSARDAVLLTDDRAWYSQPLWVPYIHYGV